MCQSFLLLALEGGVHAAACCRRSLLGLFLTEGDVSLGGVLVEAAAAEIAQYEQLGLGGSGTFFYWLSTSIYSLDSGRLDARFRPARKAALCSFHFGTSPCDYCAFSGALDCAGGCAFDDLFTNFSVY